MIIRIANIGNNLFYRGYGPVVDFFAAEGFVVIQPTHQNSKALGLASSLPEAPLFWSSRSADMKFILDHLDEIISTVPGLTGRVDQAKVAAIGHSLGGHTVAMLAGMEVTDHSTGDIVNLTEPRIKAPVLIGLRLFSKSMSKGSADCVWR